jgi:hypothetical protein
MFPGDYLFGAAAACANDNVCLLVGARYSVQTRWYDNLQM